MTELDRRPEAVAARDFFLGTSFYGGIVDRMLTLAPGGQVEVQATQDVLTLEYSFEDGPEVAVTFKKLGSSDIKRVTIGELKVDDPTDIGFYESAHQKEGPDGMKVTDRKRNILVVSSEDKLVGLKGTGEYGDLSDLL